ncbi:MAG: hypothetical protein IT546_10115 [Caulobacteraceae bacterium]|nr:hypothetical protein [Caulobacteraceae bacterium]
MAAVIALAVVAIYIARIDILSAVLLCCLGFFLVLVLIVGGFWFADRHPEAAFLADSQFARIRTHDVAAKDLARRGGELVTIEGVPLKVSDEALTNNPALPDNKGQRGGGIA